MITKHLVLAGLVLCLASSSPIASASDRGWEPLPGDSVFVDVSRSLVYLVHKNGSYKTLDALTGQNRFVWYDGIGYNASTPERSWEIRAGALERKGRSMTFGEGRFFRLSWPGHEDPRRGDETTAYGFHSHLTFEKMLKEKHDKNGWDKGTGQRSMGCILLSEEDLTLIEETWRINGEFLSVTTQATIDPVTFEDANSAPSWLGWVMGD